MKELSVEEKAKRYDEAIEIARQIHDADRVSGIELTTCEDIFTELAETDDERIRKAVIDAVETLSDSPLKVKMLAWLDKHKIKEHDVCDFCEDRYGCVNPCPMKLIEEEKPVEPEFKVGDLVVSEVTGSVYQIKNCIKNLSNNKYGYDLTNGCYIGSDEVNHCHLWTIQDAKDGDVLSWDDSKCIALFKNIYDEDSFNSYGFVGHCTDTFELRMAYHDIEGAHPATEEQRNLLFQKIKEAGYKWDAEKKELKKIEHDPAWSEEDEKMLNVVIKSCEQCGNEYAYYWLTSLKDKVQPKQVSDERNRLLGKLKEWLDEYVSDLADVDTTTLICSFTNYLDGKLPKSLRHRSQCEPSNGQINVCKEVYADILSAKGFDLGTVNSKLNRLEAQLKKLKEE